MNAAFSIWENRISPVFDTATRLAIVAGGQIDPPMVLSVPGTSPMTVLAVLLERHVSALICGAISRPIHDAIRARNIEVYPFVTGELDEVMRAWREGRLGENRFRMPGCNPPSGGGPRRKRRRGDRRDAIHAPYGTPAVPDGQAVCRCPLCGLEVLRMPGKPCSQNRCPNCHALMVRA
ncbi:MAG: NifB/NifX family molybdenum-iron cluster-binding protein [Pseudodesulfovibrio sp.]